MAEKRFLICGGCGFIGSNFIRLLRSTYPDSEIVVLDLLTYAGAIENLGELPRETRFQFVQGDIADSTAYDQLGGQRFDLVVNFAAETHVDRSLYYSSQFVHSNVLGTDTLLSYCRAQGFPLLQISTDEVYGPSSETESFAETAALKPTSPYAASKAAADLLILAAIKTFGQRAAIVRTTNNYGPRQFPEKLIPYFCYLIQNNQPLPVYGDGKQLRSWLFVDDFCNALIRLLEDFPDGEIVNIGASRQHTNLEIVEQLALHLSSRVKINHVTDRPGHDRCYRIDSSKYISRYGQIGERDLGEGIRQTLEWYQTHPEIFKRIQSKEQEQFRDTHYQQRH